MILTLRSTAWLIASLAIAAPVTAQLSPAAQDTITLARQLMGQHKQDDVIAMLTPFVAAHPKAGGAWFTLGNAHRQLGHINQAADAFGHAVGNTPGPVPMAEMSLLGMYADSGRADDAYHWLQQLRGRMDLTGVAAIPGVKKLHDDPRFADLFPDRIKFDPPFVEPGTRIIHEWRGEAAGDEFGWIARGIGDVDGDLITDITISATGNPPYGNTRGAVYAYSGKSGKLLWKVVGDSGAALGTGLEAAGDVNGDGVPDVVAGAPGMNAVLVFSGRDGKELLRLKGDSTDGDLGASASGVGDLDGDGRPDIAAGSPSSHEAVGRVYIFSGKDGHRIETLDGEHPGDGFGSTVGGSGPTLIVGAPGAGAQRTGRIYIYNRLEPKPRFVEESDSTGIALGGMFVSVIGDVDGDSVPDVYAADFPNTAKGRATGRAYVYSGKTGAVTRTFTGDVPGEAFGIGAARTGDVNGDGAADLVIGSWQYGGAAWSGGRVQVISGKDGKVLQTITGKVPGETLGFDAVGVGDIDGDGMTDYLVTSAWSMVNGFRSGRTFIVAGTVKKRR
ncbi:MAG: FG-GAP-like repeat-containing protein [Gemmatimonadota bacterium]